MAESYMDAENDYMLGMKYKDIAAKYGVTINTVKSWKQRYKWSKVGKGMHTKEKVCTQKKMDAEKKCAPLACETEQEEHRSTLSDKQYLLCLYYVKYRNKVKAYQKAYQCSYETACGNASNTFKNIEVQKEINRIMDETRQDIRIDIMDLIQQQIDIARADITDFVDACGQSVRVKENIDGTLVKEIKETQTGIGIKLYDKQKAIDFLKDNLPNGFEYKRETDTNTLAEIILSNKPNRNLCDFE